MSLEVPASQQARCAAHPEVLAGATCSRCGGFLCAACVRNVAGLEGRTYCATCAARPDVNYLEAVRLRYWGQRDGVTWMVGVTTLGVLAAGTRFLFDTLPALFVAWTVAGMGVSLVVGGAFFLGRPWARHALIALPWVLVSPGLVRFGDNTLFLLAALLLMGVAVAIHRDARNQLFFRRPVTPEALRKLWNLHWNNPLAMRAARLGLATLLMPYLAPLAVLCGAVALTRVRPHATPPIGRRGQALAGILLGVVGPLVWWFVLMPLLDGPLFWRLLD